ncbi:hypothetical protein PIB30_008333 [Stylosanthes scabra]|uniref:Ribonuclease H1 N-terminal domain-containing protein n=1 Tax=Stylosanthes scabra TaxID=79078 RepID=A0ABU6T4Q1_9FABA|nr:hypothetical protein [Stylosanthes scabra]
METSMSRFSYFAVTKGFRPGVYSSFDEANQQIRNFPTLEYQGFNSLLLANNAYEERMFCIHSDMEAVEEQLQAIGITNRSPPTTPRTVAVENGRLAPLVGGIVWLPADQSASYSYALNNNMEKLLEKVCYNTSIPPPCFFREEVFVTEVGPVYSFQHAQPPPKKTGREMRDFNYLRARRLEEENFNMRQQIEALQARVKQLESGSEDSLHFATSP